MPYIVHCMHSGLAGVEVLEGTSLVGEEIPPNLKHFNFSCWTLRRYSCLEISDRIHVLENKQCHLRAYSHNEIKTFTSCGRSRIGSREDDSLSPYAPPYPSLPRSGRSH